MNDEVALSREVIVIVSLPLYIDYWVVLWE